MQRSLLILVVFVLCILSLKAQPNLSRRNKESHLKGSTKFVGKYDIDGGVIQFMLLNDELVLVVPGAPIQALKLIGKNKFQSQAFKNQYFLFVEDNMQVTVLVMEGKRETRKGKKIDSNTSLLSTAMDSMLVLRKSTEHFLFLYTASDSITVDSIAPSMEKYYKKIMSAFGLKRIQLVKVRIYPSLEDFHNGINFPGAPDHVLATAFGKDDIRMVSPTNAGAESWMLAYVVPHEFTHCVHLNMDYSPNNPRWLWEGVAQYEAGWFFNPVEIEVIKQRQFPSLSELNNGMEYTLGYVIIEAIKDIWGFDAVIKLIKNRGDVQKALKTNQKSFEEKVYEQIYRKYILK